MHLKSKERRACEAGPLAVLRKRKLKDIYFLFGFLGFYCMKKKHPRTRAFGKGMLSFRTEPN